MKARRKLHKKRWKLITAAVIALTLGTATIAKAADDTEQVGNQPDMARNATSNNSVKLTSANNQPVQNGWVSSNGQWTYYQNGQSLTGRSYSYLPTVSNGQGYNWYLVDNGVAQSQVQQWAGSYYYFDPTTYLRVDNDYRQSQWGDWYMFGNDGRVVGGQYTYQNKTYYANSQTYLREHDQYVQTQSNGSGLLLGNDGAALSGVQSWNGGYYYFNPSTNLRASQRDYVQSQWGDWYLISDNGQVLSGVQQWAGTYYYFDPVTYLRVDNNYVQSQWGEWYMFGSDGKIITGPYKWAGGLYYFDPTTYLRVDYQYVVTSPDGRGYLLGPDGRALTGVQQWAGTYYYFDPVTYLRVDNNYVLSQWGEWYMFGPDGRIVTGLWQWYGNTYYFDPVTYLKVTNQWVGNNYFGIDGSRLDNFNNKSLIVDGVLERTDANGKVINKKNPNFPNLSRLSITGDLKGITKDDRKTVQVSIDLTDGTHTTAWATIKWQGNSSLAWAKKGYRLKLFKDAGLTKKLKLQLPGTGFKTNSFNLKSCFTDPTMGLNIVNAQLYQEVTATRPGLADSIVAEMPNYGQVNGLPVELGMNGYDQGLYVLETYHEDKLYNLNDDLTDNIALSANNDDEASTGFYQQVSVDSLRDTTFANISPEKVDQSVVNKFYELYQLANASDQDYAQLEGKYLDVSAAIDYLAFSFAINNADGLRKNITYISKNGSKWVLMPYDLDMTWDNNFDGSTQDINKDFELELKERDNKLLSSFYEHHKQEIINRYKELRTNVLSADHVIELFKNWFAAIPNDAFSNNQYLWDGVPNDTVRRKSVTPDQLYQIIRQRLTSVDRYWNI